ncbi:MAG: cytochrome P460 family protein, partial [Granulosicoccaceae bacterium]
TQNPDQIIHLFADDTALSEQDEGGQLPYGATLVAEIYKAKKDDKGEVIESALGERLQGALAAVAVMQRREGADADYPEDARNDDWDFAIFKPNGEKLDKDLVACAACHAPLADRHHLFSYQHIVNAQP